MSITDSHSESLASLRSALIDITSERLIDIVGMRNLRLVFVQIETGVKLCLLRQKILQTGFVLEGATQLDTVIGQRFLVPLDFTLLLLGAAIESAECVFDAGYRPQRVLQIEVGCVGFLPRTNRSGKRSFWSTASAEYFETPERPANL